MYKKKVAIIGAGAGGLASAKEMLDHGLIPTVFEKNSQIGGVWRNNGGNVWSNMHTNNMRFSISFSSFPWPESTELYPKCSEVEQYLNDFAIKFGLDKVVKLNCRVISAKQLEDSRWLVKWYSDTNESEIFDFLILAIGLYAHPHIPLIDGSKLFKGKIFHSINYNQIKTNEMLVGKRVIVIGHSNSATEISSDLVKQGANVLNIFRKPHWVFKKNLSHSTKQFNRKTAYDDCKKSVEDINKDKNSLYSKICSLQTKIPDLYIDAESVDPPAIAVSDDYIDLVMNKKLITRKGSIKAFTQNGIILNDNSFEYADYVLFCTGYNYDLSFFDEDILEKIDYNFNDLICPYICYKGTFHPNIKNMAFVGMKCSFIPAIELQAKWTSLVFSGKLSLPAEETMQNFLKIEKESRKIFCFEKYVSRYEDFIKFTDEIGAEINVVPDFEEIKQKNPRLFRILWEGPISSVHYNLENTDHSILKVLNEIESIMNT